MVGGELPQWYKPVSPRDDLGARRPGDPPLSPVAPFGNATSTLAERSSALMFSTLILLLGIPSPTSLAGPSRWTSPRQLIVREVTDSTRSPYLRCGISVPPLLSFPPFCFHTFQSSRLFNTFCSTLSMVLISPSDFLVSQAARGHMVPHGPQAA